MSLSMYGIVKTLHQPTTVDTCCSCRFFSDAEENLVVGGATSLRVFKFIDEDFLDTQTGPSDLSRQKKKLECMASYSLFGDIVTLSSIRLPSHKRDVILLSFKDAKLSVVEYDPHTHDLSTLSLHYFEEDDLKSGLFSTYHKPIVRVDPDLRCAAMLVYGCQLVIFPFKKDLQSDDTTSKSPFSSSYIINLSKMEERIHNIKDIQFLQGYYEPTLFILHEPIRTWSGRLPVRSDTCCISALSLNMQEKVYPVIWSMENLPFDCLRALALPKPIGGVLVFAATSLIYLNQSVPPYAASLTSITSTCTSFPMRPQEGVVFTLDNSVSTLIANDQIVISTKTGEIYVVTLLLDSLRGVRGFHFDKAASSVLPSCICLCDEGLMFLGSRLGNSLLLKYSKKDSSTDASSVAQPPVKKKKQDTTDWLATDAIDMELDELDELEVYGSEAPQGVDEITQYAFQVCDSLMNIGPCGNMCLGEPAFLAEELANQTDHDLELVTTSGYSKNGALSVLQRSIRPQIVTTFQLPGVQDMWTVRGQVTDDKTTSEPVILQEDMHSYMILSKEDSTMILQTTEEITELEVSGFHTQARTVFAGNMAKGKYTIQVTPSSVRLLLGVRRLQDVPLTLGSPIMSASVADPFLMLVSEQGNIILLELETTENGEQLTFVETTYNQDCTVQTACLYEDLSGMFTCEREQSGEAGSVSRAVSSDDLPKPTVSAEPLAVDDEDELLYGDSESILPMSEPSSSNAPDAKEKESVPVSLQKNTIEPTYWAVVVTKDDKLQVFSLPRMQLVFSAQNFCFSHKVLYDSDTTQTIKQAFSESKVAVPPAPPVDELLVVGLGFRKKPYLFARAAEELLVYECFKFDEICPLERLQLRMKRLNHGLILRERRGRGRKRQDTEGVGTVYAKQLLKYFDNIGGYTGVFVAGPYPHWFIMSSKASLRTHPMTIDQRIASMAPFHNVNCPHGFLYFNKQDELRISVLPTHLSYEHSWPLRKVPLKATAHCIKYHPESKTYLICMSSQEPCKRVVRIENDEKQYVALDRGERFVYALEDKYSVQLFSPINCEPIPGTKVEMQPFEAITSMEILLLKTESRASGVQDYVGVATNMSFNEEVTSKGRLLLYEVIDVVPEPGQPLTKNKLKEIYGKEQKGPVTAINHVDGMLIAAIGQKIYVYQLKDNDLVGTSFVDAQVYIHQMHTIKNLILVADIMKSISVLRYQSEYRVLSLVSRDIKPMEAYAIEFMVDNATLGFVATDRENNISIYMYQPEVVQSCGGAVLLRKADFNYGSSIHSMCRVRCKLTDPSTDKKFSGVIDKRHVTYFVTGEGAIGYILPLAERVYRRLDMTQKFLYTSIPHSAGLNPKTFRSMKNNDRLLQNPQHTLIDGDLVWRFLSLTVGEQIAMTKRMGTTPDQIIEDLLEMDRITAHF